MQIFTQQDILEANNKQQKILLSIKNLNGYLFLDNFYYKF